MNVMRLRADIDSGKTGDKSPGLDLAAAPLGTDDEAAGTPVLHDIADQMRVREIRPDGERLARQNGAPAYHDTVSSGRAPMTNGLSLLVIGAAVAVLACIWLLLAHGYL
jgi:hypothetical protein